MHFDVRFKGISFSQSLVEAVEEKFARLEKYEIRPSLVHITFSSMRHQKQADVYIKGFMKPFRARATADGYYEAIDAVLDKVCRQMVKEKSIVKKHKNYRRSKSAKLDQQLRAMADWRKAA